MGAGPRTTRKLWEEGKEKQVSLKTLLERLVERVLANQQPRQAKVHGGVEKKVQVSLKTLLERLVERVLANQLPRQAKVHGGVVKKVQVGPSSMNASLSLA